MVVLCITDAGGVLLALGGVDVHHRKLSHLLLCIIMQSCAIDPIDRGEDLTLDPGLVPFPGRIPDHTAGPEVNQGPIHVHPPQDGIEPDGYRPLLIYQNSSC